MTAGEASDAVAVYRLRVLLDEDRCWTVIAPRQGAVSSKEGCLGLTDYLFEEETFLD